MKFLLLNQKPSNKKKPKSKIKKKKNNKNQKSKLTDFSSIFELIQSIKEYIEFEFELK